jgi:hypothetical protein
MTCPLSQSPSPFNNETHIRLRCSYNWSRTLAVVHFQWILHTRAVNCCSFSAVIPLYYFFVILIGVRLSPLGTAPTTGLLYQPQIIDDGVWGATGGMKIGRGNRSTRRKPAPVPLCPSQIPHDQTRAQTRAVAGGSQRLTVWAMTRPLWKIIPTTQN